MLTWEAVDLYASALEAQANAEKDAWSTARTEAAQAIAAARGGRG